MAIRLKCQQCGGIVRVAEKYAGRKVKCPGCQAPLEVPTQATDTGPTQVDRPSASAANPRCDDAASVPAIVDAQPRERATTNGQEPDHSVQPSRLLGRHAKRATLIGAIAAVCAVAVLAWVIFPSGPWGRPVKVKDAELGTAFLVELKDGWYVGQGKVASPNRTFALVYSSKNIGPRAGALSVSQKIREDANKNALKEMTGQNPSSGTQNRIEVKTDTGRIYAGLDFLDAWHSHGPKRDLGEWRPIAADGKVDGIGESAFLFVIPADETPTELLTPAWLGLSRRLPRTPFRTRNYSSVFGFLPDEPDKAVPRLMQAVKDRDASVRLAAMQAVQARDGWTVDHAQILSERLSDDDLRIRSEAAQILGELGPQAKDAIPALRKALLSPRPIFSFGDGLWPACRSATEAALEKIGGKNALVAALADSIEKKLNIVESAEDLGALGPDAKQAVPALKEFIRIARRDTRYASQWTSAATQALGKIIGMHEAGNFISEIDSLHAAELQQRRAAARREAQKRVQRTLGNALANSDRTEAARRAPIGNLSVPNSPQKEREARTKGPLSGIWRDKNGLSFRIEDDETTLNIAFSAGLDPFLRRFAAKLARRDGKPDSFEGTAEAQFSGGTLRYSHRVTATLEKSGQLQLQCPEWPEPRRHRTKTLKATLTRQ